MKAESGKHPLPRCLRKLGRLWSALHWANVRRLVIVHRPETDGAITSAWGDDDSDSIKVCASRQGECTHPHSGLDLTETG